MKTANDTIKQAISDVTGIKEKDLPTLSGSNFMSQWSDHLASLGFELRQISANANVPERHLVLFSDIDEQTKGAVFEGGKLKKYSGDLLPGQRINPIARYKLVKLDTDEKPADKDA